jgi:hypothetical protein
MQKLRIAILVVGVGAAGAGTIGCHSRTAPDAEAPPAAVAAAAPHEPVLAGQVVQVPPPPFSEGIFPCSNCHAGMDVDRTRRELAMHTDIVLKHGGESRWCLDCHSPGDRDQLHLAGGELVPFDQSYRLCGQCHGEKYRDWRAGVHGRRSGEWSGHKSYLLCAHCHNPHQPRFAPIEPMPPPIRPARLQ